MKSPLIPLLFLSSAALAQQTMGPQQRAVADAYKACLPHRTSTSTTIAGRTVGYTFGWEAGFESCNTTAQQWEQVQQQLAQGIGQ